MTETCKQALAVMAAAWTVIGLFAALVGLSWLVIWLHNEFGVNPLIAVGGLLGGCVTLACMCVCAVSTYRARRK
jgi:apolipoprotein N-acyltransferase